MISELPDDVLVVISEFPEDVLVATSYSLGVVLAVFQGFDIVL